MKYEIHDTPPHIQKMLIAGYRNMTPQQKLKRVSELTKAVQQLALARIRRIQFIFELNVAAFIRISNLKPDA